VGSGGLDIHNCEKELKLIVKKNGLHNSVHFTGNVQNVYEYLQASDIFVFPTENEAFGISLIEAMACGLPVISTFVGGIKDILQNRQNGIVINPSDSQQLSDALDLLLTETSLSANLGKAARQTIRAKYSSKIVVKKHIVLFKSFSK
jgi:glycosyltransferase involved in cell wall biosynthesis